MKFKGRVRNGIIIAACSAVIIVIIILYSLFITKQIFLESSAHLEELFNQVSITFNQKAYDYRNVMSSWENYIQDVSNEPDSEQEFKDFISKQKKQWEFTEFYFIKVNNPESTIGAVGCLLNGETKEFDLRREASVLLDGNDVGVVLREKENNVIVKRSIMFAVPFAGTFKNFDYQAIGIVFEEKHLQDLITIEAFNNKGTCFIALPDNVGNVLLQSGTGTRVEEFFTFLENDCTFKSSKNAAWIKSDWAKIKEDHASDVEVKARTLLFKTKANKTEYYLTYKPVGFSDWMLMGVVPSNVLNRNMSRFRTITIVVMGGVFACIAGTVAWLLIITSKRRVAEKELEVKSREGLLDLLTQNTNDIFVLFNAETSVAEYVSSNVDKVLGLNAEELAANVGKIEEAVKENTGKFDEEMMLAVKDGGAWEEDVQMFNVINREEYWYRMVLKHSVYKGKGGYVLMLSDRTKERKMSEDLEAALSVAKSANEAKSNFLANMSHDIRTPMNAIIGFTTLCAKDAENPEKVREYIRKISFSSQHLLSLINDILDMSKIESGKSLLTSIEFNISELLEELYAMVTPQAKAKKQNFEVRTKGRMPELVYGDKLRINQILINLLSNAIKYTPNGGNILLMVEAVDKAAHNHVHLRISVKDNGMGMSEDFVKVIFEPFSRETTSATKEIQGTGLGMAITKQIVDLMGGTISVVSKQGKGSTFVVELELAVVSRDEKADAEFWNKHNIYKILVVDDDESICLEVRDLMEEAGVKVDYTLSGKDAIVKVAEALENREPYNIVLLDWKMPEMNGIETAKQIRGKVGENVPIMILTSYDFDEVKIKESDIDVFMPKPFFVSNFRNAIKHLHNEEEAEVQDAASENVSLENLKVLAAEDNEINAEILLELMDIEGVKCEIAENGQEAFDKFKASAPGTYDLIFMDVQMPVMNGYEATRAIRSCDHPEAKKIPIIAMTANAFDDDVKNALDAGMNAHLAKPIDIDKLKTIILKLRGDKK